MVHLTMVHLTMVHLTMAHLTMAHLAVIHRRCRPGVDLGDHIARGALPLDPNLDPIPRGPCCRVQSRTQIKRHGHPWHGQAGLAKRFKRPVFQANRAIGDVHLADDRPGPASRPLTGSQA